MGWMSWGIFRCQTDCSSHPSDCIDESLYRSTADALVSGGFAAAGYRTIHIDDCFVSRSRDAATGRLVANTTRFPSGTLRELAGYVHDLNLSLGAYTAEGFRTCGQYPGSRGHEELDAQTMADWQIDYLKVGKAAASRMQLFRVRYRLVFHTLLCFCQMVVGKISTT
eukprot:SAG31_NODE_1037_length_10221_cov_4.564019_6_plen_167_part_00